MEFFVFCGFEYEKNFDFESLIDEAIDNIEVIENLNLNNFNELL